MGETCDSRVRRGEDGWVPHRGDPMGETCDSRPGEDGWVPCGMHRGDPMGEACGSRPGEDGWVPCGMHRGDPMGPGTWPACNDPMRPGLPACNSMHEYGPCGKHVTKQNSVSLHGVHIT